VTRLVFYAPNIRQGGGATLLAALLSTPVFNVSRVAIVDERFPIPAETPRDVIIRRVQPGTFARIKADFGLRTTVLPDDVVICLGNLPPLLRLRGKTVLFLQNRLLVDGGALEGWRAVARFKLYAGRIWLRHRLTNADVMVVQTPTMRRLVKSSLGVDAEIWPFAPPLHKSETRSAQNNRKFDFLYVSSGEPHKNHVRLIEAWRLLAHDQLRPHLCVTLSERDHPQLCEKISIACESDNLRITNVGLQSREHIEGLYNQATAFLYPATLESFGIPLLEATAAGLPIIASEADYVRDLVVPAQTFDPLSAISIARAVKRFLNYPDDRTVPMSPEHFVRRVLSLSGNASASSPAV
jgi:glycosyltransferase involved in cell wall biosynthesis